MAAQGKTVTAKGILLVEVLETKIGSAPTKADLDAWITSYGIPVHAFIDVDASPLATFNAYGRRENTFIIELSTMKILQKITGSTDGSGDSSVKTAIPIVEAMIK